MTCSYSQLTNGGINSGVTEYVSHTGSSIQVRVLSEQDGGTGSGSDSGRGKRAVYDTNDYGVGLYHATGAGDLAFYRVMRQCSTRGWNVVARFDCSGEADRTTTTPDFIEWSSPMSWPTNPTDPRVSDNVPTPTMPTDPDVGDPDATIEAPA